MTGYVWFNCLGGGWLHGQVDSDGHLTGDNIMYIYPDMEQALVGQFHQGCLQEGYHATVCDIGANFNKIFLFTIPKIMMFRFQSDRACSECKQSDGVSLL